MKKTEPVKALSCFHCGEDCPIDSILFDDKPFCCHGCEAVYKLLNDHQLNTYYALEDNKPGIKPNVIDKNKSRFDYLDDESIKYKILDFTDNKQSRVTFFVPQMHCASCLWLLENLHRINDAVLSSQVIFLEKKLTILYDETKISLSSLVHLLSSLGYEPSIKLDKLGQEKPKKNQRLSLKMAVAGFAFANIMLFSIPEYFASEGEITPQFKLLFSILNIFLSLPVLFFSASEYFSSAYLGLKQKIINMDLPISLGIFILFSRSLYEVIALNQPGYFDSFAGLVFFLLIGKSFQKRTYDSLSFDRDYKSFFPLSVTKIENNTQVTIPITSLKIGDRLIVRSGELIPADSILINGQGLIDYSFVTGESEPANKNSGDKIFAGGQQKGGAIELETIKDVSQSYLTRLWNENAFKEEKINTFTNISNKVAKYFTLAIISIALLTGWYWYYTDITVMFNAMTAVLIIACPCALALSTPFTFGTVLRYFGKNNFYLKNSQIVEILANVNTIVFDKTGTLTTSSGSKIKYNGKTLNIYETSLLKSAAFHSAHPLSLRIFKTFDEKLNILEHTSFSETTGKGIEAVIDDNKIKIGAPHWVNNAEPDSDNKMTRVAVAINDKVLGEFNLENDYREGIKTTIDNLKSDYKLALLSGDNDSEKENLKKILGSQADINFNCSPNDKLEYIDKLRKQDQFVLMLGDGLNDAGALVKSDIGIAITEDQALFTPASDAILKADNLNMLNKFIWLAKKSLTIIKVSFLISFLYNIIGLSFAVSGMLSPLFSAILMPISSVTVVLFTTAATSLSARKAGLN